MVEATIVKSLRGINADGPEPAVPTRVAPAALTEGAITRLQAAAARSTAKKGPEPTTPSQPQRTAELEPGWRQGALRS